MIVLKALLQKYKQSVIINRFVNLFSVDILIKASSFILLPVYLKLMSQSEFGLYNYLISIIGFFAGVLNFGLYVAQTKIYPELEAHEKGSFIFTFQITLLALLVPSILIIYMFHLDNAIIALLFKNPIDYNSYRFPLLLAIIASVYSFIIYNYFLTAERISIVQRYNIIRLVLVNIVVLASLYFFKDKVSSRLLATYTIEALLVIVCFYYLVIEMKPQFNKMQMYRSIKIGFPVMTSAICNIVITFGDKFLLEKQGGFVDLSVYYLSFSLASFIPLLFSTFQNIWLPIFHKEKDLAKNLALTKKMFFVLTGAFLLLSVLAVLFIKVALAYSFIDAKYNKVLLILPIILVSFTIDSVTHLYVNYITFFEQTYVLPIFSVAIGLISIGSNIFLIKNYGLLGAAYSSLIINVIGFLAFYCLFKHNLYRMKKLGTY